jgi:hypothetical protein
LDDEESLLPELGAAGGEDEPIAVEVGELGSFHLASEDNELLPQHHVFRDKVGTATGQVRYGSRNESGGYWLGPLLEMLFCLAAKLSTETEDARHHAAIVSRRIVGCAA